MVSDGGGACVFVAPEVARSIKKKPVDSHQHALGTDDQGRDVLARLVHGWAPGAKDSRATTQWNSSSPWKATLGDVSKSSTNSRPNGGA